MTITICCIVLSLRHSRRFELVFSGKKWGMLVRDMWMLVIFFNIVKTPTTKPSGLLQPLQIHEWKWEFVNIDFIVSLTPTEQGYNAISLCVDKLTKIDHFMPTMTTMTTMTIEDMKWLFRNYVLNLHDIILKIISDWHARFTYTSQHKLYYLLGNQLAMSTSFHHEIILSLLGWPYRSEPCPASQWRRPGVHQAGLPWCGLGLAWGWLPSFLGSTGRGEPITWCGHPIHLSLLIVASSRIWFFF